MSRPPPPGGCPLGSCPRIGFITASHHLESWVTNTLLLHPGTLSRYFSTVKAQAMVDPAFKPSPCQAGSKEQTPGSLQPPHSGICSCWRSRGVPAPGWTRARGCCPPTHVHHKSPMILGKLNNIAGKSLLEIVRGNSARPYTKAEIPSIITSEKQVRKRKIHQCEGSGSLPVWSQLKLKPQALADYRQNAVKNVYTHPPNALKLKIPERGMSLRPRRWPVSAGCPWGGWAGWAAGTGPAGRARGCRDSGGGPSGAG